MKMKHLLIEGYCSCKKSKRIYPCRNTLKLGIYCLKCPQFSYAECPDEIAISNADGVIEYLEDFIGFGGEMEPNNLEKRDEYIMIWKEICREKINEAYNKYMTRILLDKY